MNKNKKIVSIIVGIVVLAGVFYGGTLYGKNQATGGASAQNRVNQFGANKGNRGAGGGFISGQIISEDVNSITIQIMSGDPASNTTTGSGSKIIFLDTSTTISKMAAGSASDLTTGTQVSVTGTANPDGSITAKTIQIKPQIKPNTPPSQQ
jgi:hypothetical protein